MVKFSCFLLIIILLCFSNFIETSNLSIESSESSTSQWKRGCNKYNGARKKRCKEKLWCKKPKNAKFCDWNGLKKTCNRNWYLNNNGKCKRCKWPAKVRGGKCTLTKKDCKYGTYFKKGKCYRVTCKSGYQPKKAGEKGCKKKPKAAAPYVFNKKGCKITYTPKIKNKRVTRCSMCCDGYYVKNGLECERIGSKGVAKLTLSGSILKCLDGWTLTRLDDNGRMSKNKQLRCKCKKSHCSTKLPKCKNGHK